MARLIRIIRAVTRAAWWLVCTVAMLMCSVLAALVGIAFGWRYGSR